MARVPLVESAGENPPPNCFPASFPRPRSTGRVAVSLAHALGSYDFEFVRPAHWLVMLLGADVVPCEILGLKGRTPYARPSLPLWAGPIELKTPADFLPALKGAGCVLADFAERRERYPRNRHGGRP